MNLAQVHARFTVGGAAATQSISSLDGERRCDGINLSQGDNVVPAEVATAKWQSENVGESEVG